MTSTLVYQWRYPVRTDRATMHPGPLIQQARHAAIRDAADDGWQPAGIVHFQLHEAPGGWSTVEVRFDAVPLDRKPAPEPGTCVDCGQRPGWGPGAVRCRPCFSERAAWQPEDPVRAAARARKRRARAAARGDI